MPSPLFSGSMEFEDIVGRIIEANGYEVHRRPLPAGAPDFVVLGSGRRWAVEAKYYRTARAQIDQVAQAAARLAASAQSVGADGALLVLSSEVPDIPMAQIGSETGVTIVGRNDLVVWASGLPDTLHRVLALLGYGPNEELSFTGRPLASLLEAAPGDFSDAVPATSIGHDLCDELRALPAGPDNWREYEQLCSRILRFLFDEDLLGWREQEVTDDGLNRYDLVCRATRSVEFWRFLMEDLGSRYVVFEFKNYETTVGQGEVLTTEKYLMTKALRKCAVILTRSGASDNARKMVQGAMRGDGKLILILSDDDVCRMLHMKDEGEEAADYLFDLVDEFLLTLPR